MINWIVIIVAFLIWLNAQDYLTKWLRSNCKDYRDNYYEMKNLMSKKERNVCDQVTYINCKNNIKKYNGNFFVNILIHVFTFFIIINSFYDNINVFAIIIMSLCFPILIASSGKNKIYTLFKEIYIYCFVLIYIFFYISDPFFLFGHKLNLFMMLPIFLIIKIINNNVKKWLLNLKSGD